jgi:hypothetical protein
MESGGGEKEWPGYIGDVLVGFYPSFFRASLALWNIVYAIEHGIITIEQVV